MTDETHGQATDNPSDPDQSRAESTRAPESDERPESLSTQDREWVERTAKQLGPFTEDEKNFLARIFRRLR